MSCLATDLAIYEKIFFFIRDLLLAQFYLKVRCYYYYYYYYTVTVDGSLA